MIKNGKKRRQFADDDSSFLMDQLASAFVYIPTAGLVWLTLNYILLRWFDSQNVLGLIEFVIIAGLFLAVSLFLPKFFSDFLIRVWGWMGKLIRWFF